MTRPYTRKGTRYLQVAARHAAIAERVGADLTAVRPRQPAAVADLPLSAWVEGFLTAKRIGGLTGQNITTYTMVLDRFREANPELTPLGVQRYLAAQGDDGARHAPQAHGEFINLTPRDAAPVGRFRASPRSTSDWPPEGRLAYWKYVIYSALRNRYTQTWDRSQS